VRLGWRPPSIVVDATFALSPMGLLVTLALSRTAEVWLPRGFYTLLDNDTFYRNQPERMGGGWLADGARAGLLKEMAQELEPWRRTWQNGRLSSRVHWIGDAQYESALPDRLETGLLPRFESCCATLQRRLEEAGAIASAPLDDCARDAIALAAALQPESSFILTMATFDSSPPPLCDYLQLLDFPFRRWAQVPGVSDSALSPAVVPLAASGRTAAIVQVVAPVILALPDGWHDSDWEIDEQSGNEDEPPEDLWRNACALWRPLAQVEAAA
jgi:hypothetical protein